ncbi:MAG: 50S ribosomal protein L24 [Nitrospinae bacterium]|nr:50S ribosomal protein L24 [Nitrospinota bacterium]
MSRVNLEAEKAVKPKVKKDDVVEVRAGKDKGRRGKILRVMPGAGHVLVEKVNMVKKHQRPNMKNRQGGIVERENKIAISNVMVVCAKCDKPVRVAKKKLEDGKNVRVCRKCGELLD